VDYATVAPKGMVFQPEAVYTSFFTCPWMLCRDRPDDKATFTVPEGLALVASGAPVAVPLTFAGPYPSLRIKRAITYSKGALFLVRLRDVMGERAFWRALGRYTRRFAGGVATTRNFQDVFAAETDRDLSALFEAWAYGPAPETPAK
jgi:aminopeptidase N